MKNRDINSCLVVLKKLYTQDVDIDESMEILDLVDELEKENHKIRKLGEKHKLDENEQAMYFGEQEIINKYKALVKPDMEDMNKEITANTEKYGQKTADSINAKLGEVQNIVDKKCRNQFSKIKFPKGVKMTLGEIKLLRDCELLTK